MSTNPVGPGTKNVTFNLPIADYLALSDLAQKSGTTLACYGKALVVFAVEKRLIAAVPPEEVAAWKSAVSAGGPAPKKSFKIQEVAA